MRAEAFAPVLDRIREEGLTVYGIETWDGEEEQILLRRDTKRHNIYSVTKAVTGLAAGMAIDRGVIAADSPVADFFPEIGADPDRAARFAGVTLERLLTMSLPGMEFQVGGDSWLEHALSQPVEAQDRGFCYSNQTAYLAGVAVSRALGEDLGAFLERELFAPLGITPPKYERSPEGLFYGASKLRLNTSETAKMGRIYLGYGFAFGRRFVSETYVRRALAPLQPTDGEGYGYYLWKRGSSMVMEGTNGQRVILCPERGRLLTMLAHIESEETADHLTALLRDALLEA